MRKLRLKSLHNLLRVAQLVRQRRREGLPGLGAGGPVEQVISRQNPWEPPGHLPLCLLTSAFQNQITSLLHP